MQLNIQTSINTFDKCEKITQKASNSANLNSVIQLRLQIQPVLENKYYFGHLTLSSGADLGVIRAITRLK
jgi:hypothetical protein